MSDDGLAAFFAARLDELEARVRYSGPARFAWLTLRRSDGQMDYTTVAASNHDEDPWTADGRVLPDQASARIVFDPEEALASIAADRELLALYEQQSGYDLPEGVQEGRDPDERIRDEAVKDMLEQVVKIRAARFSEHPDYRKDEWAP